MSNYFRITGYDPNNDFSFILDSNGMFEKMWKFSSMLIQKGMKVLEISSEDKFIDINIEKVNVDNEHIFLRATADGKPENIIQMIDGKPYNAIKVSDKIYIPNKGENK